MTRSPVNGLPRPLPMPKGIRFKTLLAATVLLPLAPSTGFAQAKPAADAAPAAAPAPSSAPSSAPAGLKPITPASTPSDAVKVLLEQANYWRSQYQPAQAVDALNRVLQIAPNNADALAMLAGVQAERGNTAAAQNAFARLKSISPGDPRIPAIDQALRVGKIDQSQLDQARRLASEGRENQAVNQYQHIFKGAQPTPGLSTEYYSVLGGSDAGWQQAKEGLAKQVTANPQDLRAQLAYAKVLTYREQTRAEGITRLNQLAANPTTAADANTALRQALLWLPQNASSIGQLQAYAARHPEDADIAQHLQAAQHPSSSDPLGEIRVEGFADLNHGRLDRAAAQFESALKTNPNDPDATGGLGLVRLRQGRTAEARQLLSRAMELDPAKRRQWQAALNGTNSGGGAAVGRQWDAVRALANRGEYAAAESRLRPLLGPNQSNTGGLLLLADIQQRAGQLAEAEATYRTVLGRQPANSAAVIGLAGVLTREGRGAEADQLFARAESMGARGVGQMRAQQLRQQAEEVNDPVAQAGLYRAALANDPSDPWLKLELARILVKQKRLSEAQAVMAGVGQGPRATQDQIRAALLFANETNDVATASALIARVPPRSRTADMQHAIEQAQVKADIANAAQLYYINRPLARERMLALAATPDQDGVHGAEVARAFLRLGDRPGAREAISTAMSSARMLTPQARVEYSGVLLEAGQTDAAAAVAGPVTAGLSTDQRKAMADLQDGIAVRSADQLKNQGRIADAYDRLAPALAASPTDPNLNMALGRLYSANNQPGQALKINEALLQQDPSNLSVRRAAVDAAIQAGSYDQAQRLVRDALQMAPNDPQVWVMSADLAKARGDSGRALHDYQVARDLHRQQLSGDVNLNAPMAPGYGAPVGVAPRQTVPNILNTPLPAPGRPANYPNGPMPLDTPRNGRSSENDKQLPMRDADADRDGAPAGGEPDEGEQLRLAQDALPKAEPAQATLPYYVSPAPQLSTPTGGEDATSSIPPASAGVGAGAGYGGYPVAPAAPGYPAAYPPAYGQAYPAYAPAEPSQPVASRRKTRRARKAAQAEQANAPAYSAAPYAAAPAYPATPAYGTTPAYGAAPAYPAPSYVGPSYPVTGYGAGSESGYANPFRGGPDATMDSTSAGILGGNDYAAPAAPVDPLTKDIDQNIATLRNQMAPKVEAGIGFRARSGTDGLDHLTEEFMPLQATYSPGIGQLKLQVTPTFLQAGSVGRNASSVNRFGSLPTYAVSPNAQSIPSNVPMPGDQNASGVGLDVSYGWKWITADIGSTPFGFREENVVGGVELAPKLSNDITLRVTGERRAVTDSLLSYAGTRDNNLNMDWGGVTRSRIHAQLEYGGPDGLNLYAGGGYGVLLGENVETNHEWEVGAGGSYPVYRGAIDEVRVGLDLVYFGYERNLDFFTLGGGGYFSPQDYFAALIPVTYRQTVGPLNWSIGGSVGFQTYNEDSSPIFPGNAGGLQDRLNALAAGNPSLATYYPGQTETGFAGGVQGDVDYRLTPAISVGARAGFQHTGNYTEGGALAYVRYTFGAE